LEPRSVAEEPDVPANSWEPETSEREADSIAEESTVAFQPDAVSAPNESYWTAVEPTAEPLVESYAEADVAAPAPIVADVTFEAESHVEAPPPPASDDSDLPAFLRDDPPPAYEPVSVHMPFAPEPEPKLFIAPASDPPADSLIDEVDAAFITAGLPTQEVASAEAIAAATTLESIARCLRAGELELRTGAATSSDAATLATVLAALLADG
jgi:hypothetical protein